MAARKTHGGFHRGDPWALTPTETRIMQLLDEGKSQDEICAGLNMAKRDFSRHIVNVRDKFLVETTGAALAKWRAKAKR